MTINSIKRIMKNKNKLNNKKKPKTKMIPLYKLFPSIITITAMCLGITAIHYAMYRKFEIAVALIFVAGFLDMIDGKVARLLNSTSEFGAQLDSLGDLVNFGVAPGIIMYIWVLNDIPYHTLGWAMVVVYIVCSALRLARFNISNVSDNLPNKSETESPDDPNNIKRNQILSFNIWKKENFFIGLPMPGAAVVCLLPMTLTFETLPYFKFPPLYIAFHMLIVGILMVSKLPIMSFKHFKIKPKYAPITIMLICIVAAVIIIEPWIFTPIFTVIYCILIPVSYFYCEKVYNSTITKNTATINTK